MLITGIILSLFFIMQVYFLCLLTQIFRNTHKHEAKKYMQELSWFFFYQSFYNSIFGQKYFNGLFTSCVFAKNIARFALGLSNFVIIFALYQRGVHWGPLGFIIFALLLLFILISDFWPRLLNLKQSKKVFFSGAFFTSFYLIAIYPFIYLFLKVADYSHTKYASSQEHQKNIKEKIYDLIQETLPDKNLEPNDRVLIEAILKFKQRIVREVMVPRMSVFALPVSTTIKEAAKTLMTENYSRIPVYKNSLDKVVGVLLYKDVFEIYLSAVENQDYNKLDQSIESLVTTALYTPETRKISHLLQEFLQKQQHLALVVDEFGSVEGVITIEDLLEEIVGEIADEYDDEESSLFVQQQNSWIVDGRTSLYEIEQKCHVKIPKIGDYDTIGGYIIHRAGSIPVEHLKVSLDDADLEVLKTTERQIVKVKITPREKLV